MDDDDHSSAAADELTPNEGDEGPEGDDLFGDEVEEDVSDGDAEHSKYQTHSMRAGQVLTAEQKGARIGRRAARLG